MRRFVLTAALAIAHAAPALTQPPPAGSSEIPSRIEELEKAGEALTQGKGDEAFKLIQDAVKRYPALPPAKLVLGRMVLRLNAQQGRTILEAAASETPDHPEVYLTMSSLAQTDNRISDMVLNAQKALELAAAPRWTGEQKTRYQRDARSVLADAYMYRQDWTNARAQLAGLLDAEPKNGMIRQRFASVLFAMNKTDEALVEFGTAAKDDATLLPAAVMMARQYMGKGDMDKAREFFDRAAKQEPSNVRVHVAYADYMLIRGDVDGAKLHAETAARLDPKNVDVQQMQGLVARAAKDYATGVKIFEEILRQQPANFGASNHLALMLSDMSDDASKKRGMQLAEINARQYSNNIEALSTLAFSYFRNGAKQQAAQALEKILSGGRASPDTAYFVGLVLAEDANRAEDAKKFLRGALDSRDLFFFRKEAKALFDKLEKDRPTPVGTSPTPGTKEGGKSK